MSTLLVVIVVAVVVLIVLVWLTLMPARRKSTVAEVIDEDPAARR